MKSGPQLKLTSFRYLSRNVLVILFSNRLICKNKLNVLLIRSCPGQPFTIFWWQKRKMILFNKTAEPMHTSVIKAYAYRRDQLFYHKIWKEIFMLYPLCGMWSERRLLSSWGPPSPWRPFLPIVPCSSSWRRRGTNAGKAPPECALPGKCRRTAGTPHNQSPVNRKKITHCRVITLNLHFNSFLFPFIATLKNGLGRISPAVLHQLPEKSPTALIINSLLARCGTPRPYFVFI